MTVRMNRRTALATGTAALMTPAILRAQDAAIAVGSLTPNTGGGGPFGPNITAAHKRVADAASAGASESAPTTFASRSTATGGPPASRSAASIASLSAP